MGPRDAEMSVGLRNAWRWGAQGALLWDRIGGKDASWGFGALGGGRYPLRGWGDWGRSPQLPGKIESSPLMREGTVFGVPTGLPHGGVEGGARLAFQTSVPGQLWQYLK